MRFYYYVLTHARGWEVRMEGHPEGSFVYDTKERAVAAAAEAGNINWTQNKRPSGVRVQLQSGQWQEERTYGNDPFPPRG